jgi:two-component system NtrC family sensor kinase
MIAADRGNTTPALRVHNEKMRAVAKLAAGLAHGINNPLSVVKSDLAAIARLLTCWTDARLSAEEAHKLMLAGQSEVEEMIRDCDLAVRRVSTLIEGLRGFAQDVEASEVEHDMAGELGAVRRLLLAQVEPGSCLIMTFTAIPKVVVSPSLVAHAILNLGSYLLGFPGEVRVSYENAADRVILRFEHSQFPVPPDDVRALFAPFAAVAEDAIGGLELATAHGLIEHSGGRIEVPPRDKTGTIFAVHLPTRYHASKSGKFAAITRADVDEETEHA